MNHKLIIGILIPAILLLVFGSAQASIHPTIKIVNPMEGEIVMGKLIIIAEVRNVDIESLGYGASVQLYLDDKKFKGKGKVAFSEGSTITYEWTANSIKNGEHTVWASACHSKGWICYFAAPITFTISKG